MITINETKTQICHRNGNMVLPELKNNVSKETHYNSDSNSSNSSGEAFEIQAIRDAFDNSKCSNGEEGLMFCTNPNCQDNAVICFKKRCDCRKTHKNCSKAEFDGFLDSYDFKLKEQKKTIKKVEKIFENLIDEISRIEDEIIKTIHGSFLTHHQADFVLKISNQDFSSLKGKQISKAFSYINEINKKQDYNDFVDQLIEDIEDLSKQSIKSFSKLHNQLEKEKNKTKKENNPKQQKKQEQKVIFQNENASGINSKIITEEQQVQTLKQFFTKKSMKSMKLLYRASQNKFSMEKFYDKCSNIPNTLILMKTEFDKIIGGYTPLIWKKYEGAIKNRLEDPSLESFIFSVSEKEKLQLTEKENATYYLSYAPGPRFGKQGCADLWICDEANKKADSYVLGNMSYGNKKYSSSVESYERFVGGPSEYFTTKDWQCFQVQFQ